MLSVQICYSDCDFKFFYYTVVASSPPVTASLMNNDISVINVSMVPPNPNTHNSGASCAETSNSSFNFDIHTDMVKQITKSPGDGFLFQSRPMFTNAKDMLLGQVRFLKSTLFRLCTI